MRVLLLAAGRGERLRPLTDDRPKCLVEVEGRPLLQWQLTALRACGLRDFAVVRGYRCAQIQDPELRTLDNPDWARTNMVRSLLCAASELRGDVLIVYTDLLFGAEVVRAALSSHADIGVVVDRQWRTLWERRMEDPLLDAETLRLGDGLRILEIGGRPRTLEQIEAQYVGIVRLSSAGCEKVRALLQDAARQPADASAFGSERPLDRAHLTDLLMGLVRRGERVQAIPIDGGWAEVDTPRDLAVAAALARERGWTVPPPTWRADRRGATSEDASCGASGAVHP